ncbi:MAG: alpha/beta hydrolase [bacterium]
MEEKVYFKNGEGLKLCGILTKPSEETQKCIILCHGITVNKEEDGIFTKLARRSAQSGFAVFRFDFRGHGESEGNSIDLTVSGEKRDLESAVRFLQNLGYRKFGIVAASFGGGAVALFVPENQDIVKALVLWNANIDYDNTLEPKLPWPKENFGKEAMQKLEEQGYLEIGSGKFKVGKPFFVELRKLYPWKKLQNIKTPILFIHGDKDSYVPYEDSVKYSKLFQNAKLKTIVGAEHGFHEKEEDADEADNATIRFFLNNF